LPPNILAIHDIGTEGETAYLVTELLEGETLRQRLTREWLHWRRSVETAAPVADGLAAAQGKGIAHRDIKPEKVFLAGGRHLPALDVKARKKVPLRNFLAYRAALQRQADSNQTHGSNSA